MQKGNNRYLIIAEYIIVLLVYSIIVIWLFDKRTPSFWVAYLFTVLAFVIQIIELLTFLNKKANSPVAFMGISIGVYSSAYLLVQMLVGIVFMLFTILPVTVAVIIEIIILVVYIAIVIACLVGMIHAETLQQEVTIKKNYISELQNIFFGAADSTEDKVLKKKLQVLAEDVKYSDPISHETLMPLERRLEELALDISDSVGNVENQIIAEKAEQFKKLLAERNRKCMMLKR